MSFLERLTSRYAKPDFHAIWEKRDYATLSAERFVALLKYNRHEGVRGDAARTLKSFKGDLVERALTDALKDKSHEVRGPALDSLTHLIRDRAVPIVSQAFQDPEPSVRGTAAFLSGFYGLLPCLENLTRAASDENCEVRCSAIYALGKLRRPETLDLVAHALQDANFDVRNHAINALSDFDDQHALNVLKAAQDHRDADTRKYVRQALQRKGVLPTEQARPAVQQAPVPAVQQAPVLDAIVVVFNRDFSTSKQFVDEILSQLTTQGRTYRSWMSRETPVRIRVHPQAQDQMTAAALALVEFRRLLGNRADPKQVQFATFEGSKGIGGSVLSHWH